MNNLTIENKLWLQKDGQFYLGKGRVELLQAIVEHGSISAAARSMQMSYKKAWTAIDEMNSISDEPLVVRKTGGSAGGGTFVTEAGKKAISLYERINIRCIAFLDEEMKSAQ